MKSLETSHDSIFIAGYYGFENAGDETILRCMIEHLRALRPQIDITVASGNPEATIRRHGVKSVPLNDIDAIRAAVEQSGQVLIGGGGLFHDYWGVDPDTFLTDRHWGAAYFAGPAVLAMLHQKPLMLYAMGVGPLLSEHGRTITRMVCDTANTITVRDAGSRSLLESIGVDAGRVAVTADPAFAFHAKPWSGEIGKRPILGVSLRPWAIGAYPDFWQREVAAALDAFVDKQGGSILFLPFQTHTGDRENDRAVAERVRSSMRKADSAQVWPDSSPESLFGAICRCDVVLGMRLHALIFAFLNRRPFVALSYDPKINEFLGAAGVENFALDIASIDARQVARLLEDALAAAERFGAPLDDVRRELARLARENACAAIKLLEGGQAAHFTPDTAPLLARTLKAQSSENTALRRRTAELEARLEAVESAAAREREAIREAQKQIQDELRSTRQELHGARAELHGTQAELHSTRQELHGTRAELHDTRAELHGTQAELHDTRKVLADSAAGVAAYRSKMADALAVYRSQRAWKVMLATRKMYTLLARQGAVASAKWAVRLPLSGVGPLDEHELAFPDILENVPAALLEQREPAAAPAIPRQHKYDVIVLAIIDFDFRFQRPQQIAAQYARDGHRVFWISPTRFLPSSSTELYRVTPLRQNLWEIHLRGQQPDIYLGQLNEDLVASMIASLRKLCRDWAVSESVALIQLPFWRKMALRLRQDRGCRVVYDCMDEWATFPNMGAFNIDEEKSLVSEADVLVVSGRTLEDKFRAAGLRPVLARNGVDFAFYNQAHPPSTDLRAPKPVIGYFGAIADWMDIELVRAAALARPQYSFVMVGQVFRDDIAKLELPNVYLLGSKPYEEIPSYLEHFEVCVIPFVLNEVTKATDPVKLYEYLARGKPVVATAMAELEACADLIYISSDADDYALKLDRAVIENDAALRERRIAYAAANTWEQRCRTMDAAIRQAFPLISIIVVTHNSAEFVTPCLESIDAETSWPNYEVIVLDNASTDGTWQAIRAYLESRAEGSAPVEIRQLPANIGFARANNAGAQAAKGDYLVLLNSDTMVTSGWLGRLLRHFEREPALGLVCPVTNFAGNEAMIETGYVSSGEMQSFAQDLARMNEGKLLDLDVAPLYCAMLRRSLWNELGGLDERFEIGMFEDDDCSLQVRKRGLRVAAAEDCFVHHFGQGSFAKLSREAYEEVFRDNRQKFEEKWKITWKAHQTRPNVKPAFERMRFAPASFCSSAAPEPIRHAHT